MERESINPNEKKKRAPKWLNVALATAITAGAGGLASGCVESGDEEQRFQAELEKVAKEKRDLKTGFVIENKDSLANEKISVNGTIDNLEKKEFFLPLITPQYNSNSKTTEMKVSFVEKEVITGDLTSVGDDQSIKVVDESMGIFAPLLPVNSAPETDLGKQESDGEIRQVIGKWEKNNKGEYFLQVEVVKSSGE